MRCRTADRGLQDHKDTDMKISDLLRRMADQMELTPDSISDQMPNRAAMAPVEVDHTDHTDSTTMMPATQQELELLKKMAGVENVYDEPEDQGCGCDGECGCGGHEEQPAQIIDLRKLAGL